MVKRCFSTSVIHVIGYLIILSLLGCASPSQNIQETAIYKHFSPAEYPGFQITFDYPVDWKIGGSGTPLLAMLDMTEPTLAPGEEQFFGDESILLQTKRGDVVPFSQEISHYLQLDKDNPDLVSLTDREIEIDGYPARWLTFEFQDSYNTPIPFIKEMIFLFVENQQRYYIFMLQIPTAKRGERYEQTFDLMIDTLKVVPDE